MFGYLGYVVEFHWLVTFQLAAKLSDSVNVSHSVNLSDYKFLVNALVKSDSFSVLIAKLSNKHGLLRTSQIRKFSVNATI